MLKVSAMGGRRQSRCCGMVAAASGMSGFAVEISLAVVLKELGMVRAGFGGWVRTVLLSPASAFPLGYS